MIVVMDKLGFIERHAITRDLVKEKIAVIRHVDHCCELDPPGIALFSQCLINQHWHSAVDLLCKLRIHLTSEHRACAGIGIQQRKIIALKREMASVIAELVNL